MSPPTELRSFPSPSRSRLSFSWQNCSPSPAIDPPSPTVCIVVTVETHRRKCVARPPSHARSPFSSFSIYSQAQQTYAQTHTHPTDPRRPHQDPRTATQICRLISHPSRSVHVRHRRTLLLLARLVTAVAFVSRSYGHHRLRSPLSVTSPTQSTTAILSSIDINHRNPNPPFTSLSLFS